MASKQRGTGVTGITRMEMPTDGSTPQRAKEKSGSMMLMRQEATASMQMDTVIKVPMSWQMSRNTGGDPELVEASGGETD